MSRNNLDPLIDSLKAVGESSRFRILALLATTSLTVSDVTSILGQSQPRVSRHLKLLIEAGLITRHQEGSWAFFDLTEDPFLRGLVERLVDRVSGNDQTLLRDRERLDRVRAERAEKAADYFSKNAQSWDEIRRLHVADGAVEAALKAVVGSRPIQAMLDLGTGTGRMLELFSDIYVRGTGVDASREMLAIARSNADKAELRNVHFKQGDIYAPPVEPGTFDLGVIHQVLHYLDDPERAIAEAARCLRPSGRLVVVDFAPHDLDILRDKHAHLRSGFSDRQMKAWFKQAGLVTEDVVEVAPDGGEQKLTVKIWVGRDPRLLIAEDNQSIDAFGEIA